MLKSWKNVWRPKLRGKPFYQAVRTVASMDDVPADPGLEIYLVKRAGTCRWAVLACPCRCGRRIEVNLMKSRYPYWKVRKHLGSISLSPSLWMPEDTCGSHFWLRRNRVIWADWDSFPKTSKGKAAETD